VRDLLYHGGPASPSSAPRACAQPWRQANRAASAGRQRLNRRRPHRGTLPRHPPRRGRPRNNSESGSATQRPVVNRLSAIATWSMVAAHQVPCCTLASSASSCQCAVIRSSLEDLAALHSKDGSCSSPASCSAQTRQKHPEPTHRRDRPDITLMLKALGETIITAPVHAGRFVWQIHLRRLSIDFPGDLAHGVQRSVHLIQRLRLIAQTETAPACDSPKSDK
jgi:hypothetical protein